MGAGEYFGGLLVMAGDKNANSEATAVPYDLSVRGILFQSKPTLPIN